ncbi:nucleoside phosphorylase [Clostridium sp. 19966]|uniref:nucleoside phosphorylase n=1 Tax=Clostridium sp. 19966 TaxID=2768166 RepID=UPI0028DE017C|nr:nucleoside phosphorylase [Clostridium sp. 19966]MDT8719148.1 nucleoside phosphorylase [Clostridium sp. 19966]
MEELQPHIRLNSAQSAKYAILPGDPKRVDAVKEFLKDCVDLAYNREYKSCSGFYKGVKVIVISTGIGGPSASIAVEELKNIGVDTLIRIGSCGAYQPNMKLGDLIIASAAVRDEGTSKAYIEDIYPAFADTELLLSLVESAKDNNIKYHCGVVRSHDALYADNDEEKDKYWASRGVLGADMETAAIFVAGSLRKLKTASVLNVVVESNGSFEEGISNYVKGENATKAGERKEILTALEAIVKLENTIK